MKYAFDIKTMVMVEADSEDEAWDKVEEHTRISVSDFVYERNPECDEPDEVEQQVPELVHIVAMDRNQCIGMGDKLPWHIPTDLKYFKQTTDNHIVLFGSKTYDALPKINWGNRTPFRLTQKGDIPTRIEDLWNYGITEVLGNYITPEMKAIFICGGAEIYKASLDHVNTLLITEVDLDVKGDKFYPEFRDKFKLVHATEYFTENRIKFRFTKWVRA